MPRPSNEQDLLRDRAERILATRGVTSAAYDWRGSRTLLVHVDPAEWAVAGASMPAVEAAAADRGFKVLLLAPERLRAPERPGPAADAPVRSDGVPGGSARHHGLTDERTP